MTEPIERAHRLAMILEAIDRTERDFGELKTEHKDKMERLRNHAYALRQEILSGQMSLVTEQASEPEPAKAGD